MYFLTIDGNKCIGKSPTKQITVYVYEKGGIN